MANGFSISPGSVEEMLANVALIPANTPRYRESVQSTPAVETNPSYTIPQLNLPEQPGFMETMIPGIQQALASLATPEVGRAMLQQSAQAQEQRRLKRAAAETQAITSLYTSALASGNPGQLAEVTKQLSGLKTLQPETVQALQAFQLKLAEKVGETQRENEEARAMADVLSKLPNEEAQLAGQIIRSNPRVKPADVVKMYEKGMLTDPKVAQARQIQKAKDMAQAFGINIGGAGGVSGSQPFTMNISKEGEVSFTGHEATSGYRDARTELSAYLPENHPDFNKLLGEYMMAKSYVSAEVQNLAMSDVLKKATMLAQGGRLPPVNAMQKQLSDLNTSPQAHVQVQRDVLGPSTNITTKVESLLERAMALKAQEAKLMTQAREDAQRKWGQLPATLQAGFNQLTDTVAITNHVLNSFTEKEIHSFVGLINRPASELQLTFTSIFGGGEKARQKAARFADFKVMLERLRATAFTEGGKQLTPFEASVVFGYTPTGNEYGGGIEFMAKLRALNRYAQVARDNRVEVARTAPAEVDALQLEKRLELGLAGRGYKPGQTNQFLDKDFVGKLEASVVKDGQVWLKIGGKWRQLNAPGQ